MCISIHNITTLNPTQKENGTGNSSYLFYWGNIKYRILADNQFETNEKTAKFFKMNKITNTHKSYKRNILVFQLVFLVYTRSRSRCLSLYLSLVTRYSLLASRYSQLATRAKHNRQNIIFLSFLNCRLKTNTKSQQRA